MLEPLIKFTETFTYVSQFILKNIDVQSDEEMQKVRSERVLGAGSSVLVELGCVPLLACGYVHQPRRFWMV